MTEISGEVVLVTGANGGLGTQFVNQALALGASRVNAAARTPRDWADPRVVPLPLNVTDGESVAAAAATAHDVAIVINNAGIARPGGLLDGPIEDTREQMETNFFGPVLVARAFAGQLRKRRGALINIGSVLSWYAIGQGYSTSKAALWSATNAMRLEVVRDILAGLLQGADEVLADDLTRQVRAALAGPVTVLYAS